MKALKRFIAIFMCVVLTLTAAPLQGFVGLDLLSLFDFKAEAVTYSGTCGDDLTWTIDTSTGALEISGTGAMTDWSSDLSVPWYSYRNVIKTVNISTGVTTIGNYTFYYCTDLTSITLPDSVTTIGSSAFEDCDSLTSITISDSVAIIGERAFGYCDSLTSITIPDSVATIGERAFGYCDSLTNIIVTSNNKYYSSDSYGVLFNKDKTELIQYPVGNTRISYTIPYSVTTIGEYAFCKCDNLTSVTIPDGVTTIGNCAFRNCDNLTSVTIPDSVTTIGNYAFGSCVSLTSVIIGDSVTTIGFCAFEDCFGLTSVTIPDSVTTIDGWAFKNCDSLTSVAIGDGVSAIGDYAFWSCASLTSITVDANSEYYSSDSYGVLFNKDKTELIQYPIGNTRTSYTITSGVATIGNSAFEGCGSLTSITIGNSVTTIGDSSFRNCDNLTSVTIPDSVITIGGRAFESCNNLTSVTIPNSVTTIGNYAFWSCANLISVTIPDSVTSISGGAFGYCTSLTSVTIPNGVTTIGDSSFRNCGNLTSVTIPDSVTTIGDWAFEDCYSLTDVYYTGTQNQWKKIFIDSYNSLLTSATIHYIAEEENTTEEWTTEEWTTEENVTQEYIDEESTYIIDATTTVPVTEQPSIEDESDLDSTTTTRVPETTTREPETTEEAPTDPDGFITILAGETKTVSVTGGKITYIRFVPTKTALYTFCSTGDSDTYGYLYNSDMEQLASNDDGGNNSNFSIIRSLNAGETYYIGVRFYDTGASGLITVNLTKLNDYTMSVGDTKTVSVTGGNITYIRFVPTETALYTFCSTGDSDTYGYLYNSDMEQLASNDDGGNSTNFSITHSINAGETYYFGVRFYSTDASGSITVNLTKSNGCGNNLTWSFNESTGVLTVSGTGNMYDYLSRDSSSESNYIAPRPWEEYIASITSVVIGSGVTSVGTGAFFALSKVETVSLPETVLEIGSGAFAACTSLTGFTVDENNPIFMADEDGVLYGKEDMNALPEEYRNEDYDYALLLVNYPIGNGVREYTVAENVYAVGDFAFACCPTLEKITFPQTYMSLGEAVLSECPALRTVTLNPLKLMNIGDNNYDWIEQCPELIYNIEADCGVNVKSSLIINAKEESVCGTLTISGTGAMYNYESYSDQPWHLISDFITEVIIEDGVTTIGDNAFKYCSSINSVTIPDSVTRIGEDAFYCCDSLNDGGDVYYSGTIEQWSQIDGNENINGARLHVSGSEALLGCGVCGDNVFWTLDENGLLTISGTGEMWSYSTGQHPWWKYDYRTNIKEIVIEDGVTTVTSWAFGGCYNLTSVVLSDSLTIIDEYAFYDCDGLTSITIPDEVTEICYEAFRDCNGLTSVNFGENSKITEIGYGAFKYCDSLSSIDIPESVRIINQGAFDGCYNLASVTFGENSKLTTIGNAAFSWCSRLDSITIPDSVTAIGDRAFLGCDNLASVTIPDSVIGIGIGAFLSCDSFTAINVDEANEEYCSVDGVLYSKDKTVLVCYPAGKADKEFTIPDTVKEIGAYAFAWCYNLETLTIPDSVTTIGSHAFYGSEFTIVSSFGGLTEIGDYAFAWCHFTTFDIPEGIETIGNYAFYDCYNLQSVTIPDSVTVIGSYAFSWCQNLQSVTIPDSVVAVGKGAFNQCSSLTKAEIGSGLKRIPQNMFESCYNLTEVEISEGVTDIGDYAFYDCDALKTVNIPASISTIGTEAFDSCESLEGFEVNEDNGSFYSENGVLFNKDKTVLICYPAGKTAISYTIPSTVTEIAPYAFSGAANLRQITIPAMVTTIGGYAFSYSGLISVELENGITVIGEDAFANCIKLQSVSIPATITRIETNVFYRCHNLTDVYYYSIPANWNEIEIGYNNYCLTDQATIHYVTIQTENYEFINGELIVTGGSTVATRFSNLDFAQDITKITVKGEVEQILEFVFADLPNVTEVNIAKTVSSIGNFAFENCPKLKTVNLDVEFEEEYEEEETTEEPVCEISEENSDWDIAYNGEIVPNAEAEDNVTTTTRAYTTTTRPPTTTTAPTTTVAPTTTTQEDTQEYTTIIRDERPTTTRPYEEPEEDEYPSYRTIGIMAFAGCESLENIVIPETFKAIGNYAFADCTKLNSVTLNDGLKNIGSAAFNNCTSLSEITIPVSVKEMGYDAFYGCSLLETVYFNAVNCDITSASDDEKLIFGERDSLKNFYFGDKVHTIPYEILRGNSSITEIVIPDNVTYISSYAFYNCSALTKAVIGSGVESMGDSVFSDCDALTDVTIRDGATIVGEYAFAYCDSLTSVTIPDGITTINGCAFHSCSSLTTIIIPNTVTSILWGAFSLCYSLQSITVDADNEYYSSDSFGVLFNKDKTELIQYPIGNGRTSYTIPETVITIYDDAFHSCESLVKVIIPDSVTNIYSFAFSSCTSLLSITIPDSITEIPWCAFWACHNLRSVTISDSVTYIDYGAFSECYNLSDVYYTGTEGQWNEISIVSNNTPLTSANIHFNSDTDTDIASGTCGDNLTWTLDANGKLTISGTGEMDDFDADYYTPWSNFYVTSVEIKDGVKSVGSSAFDGYEISSVTIPDSVTKIGFQAFADCDELTNIILPDGLLSIEQEAFWGCDGLTSVTIPANVSFIGQHAFGYCENLLNFSVVEENEYYSSDSEGVLFNKDKTILVSYLYANPSTDYTIPDGVVSFGNFAFATCKNLKTVNIPDSVVNVNYGVFYDCINLTDIIIPNNVEEIGPFAFAGCDALTSIIIPDSVTIVDGAAFEDCDNLADVRIGNGVTTIGSSAFSYCKKLSNLQLGTKVNYIGYGAFSSCDSLTSIVIPESITTIEGGAFAYCDNLKSIIIDENCNLISISENTFCECSNLNYIFIPDSVMSIGDWAFEECDNLIDVYYSGTQEQWNAISIGESNEPLVNAEIHFNSESPATEVDRGTCGDNLTWVLYEDGELVISGAGDMYNYTYLGQTPWAEYNDRIVEITIGEGVTSVGIGAFYSCSAVKSISLPSTVYNIRLFAFGACTALEEITVSSDNALFCSEDGVVYNKDKSMLVRYPAGKTATSFDIPESVQTIGNEAFSESVFLESVIIPESVKKIDYHAFYSSQALKTVEISAGVEIIGNNVFDACYSLEAINVSADNAIYSSADGVLFNKTRTELIYYPAAKGTTYTIPDGVKTIKENAFLFSNVDTFVVPTSVTVIEAAQCKYGSANKTVHYAGTKAEWNKISIDSSEGLNDALINANVHFGAVGVTYTVTYHINGGSGTVPEQQIKAHGETLVLDSTRPNGVIRITYIEDNDQSFEQGLRRVFVEWNTEPDGNGKAYRPGAEYTADTNLELFAIWEDAVVGEFPFIPVKEGYMFVGWFTSPTGGVQVTPSTKWTEDIILYAHWAKQTYETSNCKISIKRPKVNEVNYGDVLIFEAVTNDLPEGAKVVWSVSGDVSSKPIISNDGMNCEVYAKGKGEIKVTATVVNAEGVPYQNVNGNIIKAQKSFSVKAGFREIFIWILKSLFGLTTVYTPETFL